SSILPPRINPEILFPETTLTNPEITTPFGEQDLWVNESVRPAPGHHHQVHALSAVAGDGAPPLHFRGDRPNRDGDLLTGGHAPGLPTVRSSQVMPHVIGVTPRDLHGLPGRRLDHIGCANHVACINRHGVHVPVGHWCNLSTTGCAQ